MSGTVLIIGLDHIGASIGLAIAESELELSRIGFALNDVAGRAAQKAGAVESLVPSLARAVQQADLLILNIPPLDMPEYLPTIAKNLSSNAVILDASLNKQAAMAWAAEHLPEGCDYVGIWLATGADGLDTPPKEQPAPRADLFRKGIMGIAVGPTVSGEAMKLAVDLANVLGAAPMFIDPVELDAATAHVEGLPSLLGIALMKLTAATPSWRDLQRFSDRAFFNLAGLPAYSDAKALAKSLSLQQQHLVPRIALLIQELQELSALLSEEKLDEFIKLIEQAGKDYRKWLEARRLGEWEREQLIITPEARRSNLAAIFGFGGLPPKKKS
jgi:prephenate dehydrogenase